MLRPVTFAAAATALLAGSAAFAQSTTADPRAALYKSNCSACHDTGVPRAPTRDVLGTMAPEQILAALESGPMISMGLTMSTDERRQLAEYLAGRPLTTALVTTPPASAMCAGPAPPFAASAPSSQGF